MSKYQFQQSDIYQPGTDLPINRLNIGDAEILHEIEAQLLQQAYQTFVAELATDTRFDEAYFQFLHQRTFESLYAWAGQYRTQDMVKGGSIDYGLALRDDSEVDNNYIRASIDCVQRADHALLRELVFAGLSSSESEL